MPFKIALLPLTMPLVLAACLGGGGNGSSSARSDPLSFTSNSAIEPNSLVEAEAGSSVNDATDVVGGNVDRGGEITVRSSELRFDTGDLTDPLDPDSDPEIEALRPTLTAPDSLVRDFAAAPTTVGDDDRYDIEDGPGDPTDRLYLNEGEDLEYLNFGIWKIGIDGDSIDLGGAAWGALTPTTGDNPMPTAGSATYEGELIGNNVLAASTTVYIADAEPGADFDANTVTFTSENTRELGSETEEAPGLDIVGAAGTIVDNAFASTAINLQDNIDDPSTTVDGVAS